MLGGEDKEVVDEALSRYKKTPDISDLPAELRTIILTAVARFGNDKDTEELLGIYESTNNVDLKHSISSAITETRDKERARKIIARSIGEGGFVRPQDIFRWYAYLMRSQYTRELAWQWLNDDWTRLEKIFGGSKTLDYLPVYSAGPLSTPQWKKKYEEFFTLLLNVRSLERNIRIGFSEIDARIDWRKREEPKLKQYF
jgi:aminopeptidase N